MKNYTVVIVKADPFEPEILSSFLWDAEPSGIEEMDNSLKLFFESSNPEKLEIVTNILEELKIDKLISEYSVDANTFEDQNWNEEWEKGIQVIRVTDKIVIKPTFREYSAKSDEIVITIDPKMSFGTGEHQTTKLILSLLEKYVTNRIRVLDVGSGTAVLAITAIKLGAATGIAIDNDLWCLDNAKENASLNNVQEHLDVRLGEIKEIKEVDFDLVLANIQKNVLIPIAKDIAFRTKVNGVIILSGLLINDEKSIVNEYTKYNFSLVDKSIMDEWIALVFKKIEN
jgi:ribosomal protein L11 methyltransferase